MAKLDVRDIAEGESSDLPERSRGACELVLSEVHCGNAVSAPREALRFLPLESEV